MKDNGVYILSSPSVKDESVTEYRVAYLDSNNNIHWDLECQDNSQPLNPSKARPYFDKSTVYTNHGQALAIAHKIGDDVAASSRSPVYYVNLDQPYISWSTKPYGKENKN